jgi:hypothetical protein
LGITGEQQVVEGRASYEVFSEELDLKGYFALGTFATIFQAEIFAILAFSDYCLRECMTDKTLIVSIYLSKL